MRPSPAAPDPRSSLAAPLAACGRPPDLVGIDNPAATGRVGRASATDAPPVHHDDPRGLRGRGRLLRRRPGARARPRLGRRHRAADPPRRAISNAPSTCRPTRAPSSRSSIRRSTAATPPSSAAIDAELAKRPRGPAPAAALRPRLQQHHERRDPAADPVRPRHRLPGRAGALHLGLRGQGAALRLRPQQRARRAHRSSSRRPASSAGPGPTSVDVFAHSMGTFLAMEGLRRRAGRRPARSARPHRDDHPRLAGHRHRPLPQPDRPAAAGVPREDVPARSPRTTARCGFRGVIAGGVPRVGAADADELEKLGVTVIDLSEIDDFERRQPRQVRRLARGRAAHRRRAQPRRPLWRDRHARARRAPRRRPDPHPRRIAPGARRTHRRRRPARHGAEGLPLDRPLPYSLTAAVPPRAPPRRTSIARPVSSMRPASGPVEASRIPSSSTPGKPSSPRPSTGCSPSPAAASPGSTAILTSASWCAPTGTAAASRWSPAAAAGTSRRTPASSARGC